MDFQFGFDVDSKKTAYVATISFLRANGQRPRVIHDPRILSGIREGFYTLDEVRIG